MSPIILWCTVGVFRNGQCTVQHNIQLIERLSQPAVFWMHRTILGLEAIDCFIFHDFHCAAFFTVT